MADWYPWIVLLHLACAIVFVGAVAFEVIVVESLHKCFDIRCDGFSCVGSRFSNWLLLKVVLAFGVLGVFVNAMWAMRHGKMDVCRFKYTHCLVLALMVGIVFLAKTMFYYL
ncbi:MAG: hypothetical protein EPN69_02490 [Rhodanobacter sp.]|nr:MAG: hypothetical protein EPN69_02490 [Rhodanobacter sp.]TAM38492.1 MAG: hypothetical protein EPN58_16960 [Rhodanobacter sp.]TAN27075.1 MAG: hypothetical protein EPN32_05075 [Rhodanobacter sp.]